MDENIHSSTCVSADAVLLLPEATISLQCNVSVACTMQTGSLVRKELKHTRVICEGGVLGLADSTWVTHTTQLEERQNPKKGINADCWAHYLINKDQIEQIRDKTAEMHRCYYLVSRLSFDHKSLQIS